MGIYIGFVFKLMILKVYIYSLIIVKCRMGEGVYSVGLSYKIYMYILKKLMKLNF